jgi:hypothetical protein
MSYLSFNCFRSEASDHDIELSILRGDYVFHDYAESQWLEHIKKCAPSLDSQALSGLCLEIVKFMDIRENLDFEGLEHISKIVTKDLTPFKDQWPDIFDKLCDASMFFETKRKLASLKDGNPVVSLVFSYISFVTKQR